MSSPTVCPHCGQPGPRIRAPRVVSEHQFRCVCGEPLSVKYGEPVSQCAKCGRTAEVK